MDLHLVTDPDDPRLDDYRGLTDTALRMRTESANGLYIAESAKVIERAVRAGHSPRSVMVQRRWTDGIRSIMRDVDVPVYEVPDAVAESVAGFDVHRGALAAMHRPVLPDVAAVVRDARLVLILAGIGDHTNIGAAFRAAAGLGADAVLVAPRCADPLYRRSVRVSMGTVFQVPWTRMSDWQESVSALHAEGIEVAALALSEDAVSLREYARRRPDRVALLMGSEGDGLSAEELAFADRVVTIPMRGGVDSLNVASAAAVALYALGDD
ncbi:TrmH family RNA methyltransferase [Microbacterium sp. GCS4]|uniref:TrmH family RNA methyltransferase n=1 Tax=Microbacterium sp. GCS4 TaxID=1692239 RepID=UPI0006836AB1|nr:RNA methyltransferase [Microbacterium sp. GCS4]KNY07072.1 rRNA methyltransferase [Microbacterium sp. GCS4]